MSRVCTRLNHTERTTETKKKQNKKQPKKQPKKREKSYKGQSSHKNRRYRDYSTAHYLCFAPSAFTFVFFFFISVIIILHNTCSSPGCWLSSASHPPSTQSLYRRLSGDHRSTEAKGFRVTLVEVCTGFFFFVFFLYLLSLSFFFLRLPHVNRHTQISRG